MSEIFRRTLWSLSSTTSMPLVDQNNPQDDIDQSTEDIAVDQQMQSQLLKHRLTVYVEQVQNIPRFDTLQRLQVLVAIKQILVDAPETKDTFREAGGYISLVSLLSSLEGIMESTSTQDSWDHDGTELEQGKHTKQQVVETFKAIFSVLAETMSDHDLNRDVFQKTVGFDTVENALLLSGILAKDGSPDHAFGILFGFAIEDASVYNVFAATRRLLKENDDVNELSEPKDPVIQKHDKDSLTESSDTAIGSVIRPDSLNITNGNRDVIINSKMAIFASKTDVIRNPLAIMVILNLQREIAWDKDLSYAVYRAIYVLAFSNRRNQVVMNDAGVVHALLQRLSPSTSSHSKPSILSVHVESYSNEQNVDISHSPDDSNVFDTVPSESLSTNFAHQFDGVKSDTASSSLVSLRPNELALIRVTCNRLIEMGVSTQEIRFMFEQVAVENANEHCTDIEKGNSMMDMILSGIRQSRWPKYVQFDMSQHGYSSIELNSIGARQFPPSNNGYSFIAWINIERYDPNMHLTVFGLYDKSRKCFMMAYIERDTHRLILQTSLDYSIRFKSFVFRPNQWYHIAIVHQRPRYSSSSKAALFVDGRLVESCKCTYPSQPGAGNHVQAFLGTPKEFSPRLGKGMACLAWNIGPAYLIDDDLPEDLLHVYYQLGPRYCGNFQDSLGQFQTYQTSSLLNLRLDAKTREKAAKNANDSNIQNSIIVNAIRGKNSLLMPEDRILFAFTANNVLSAGDSNAIAGCGLSESGRLSLRSAASRAKVIVNAAVSKLEKALLVQHGLGYLTGEPVVANPCGIDESMWKIGGCAVGLRLVELAETSKQLYNAVSIITDLIRYSWRNSEDMEKINGYEILANLLRNKADLITTELELLLAEFVGLNRELQNESVVISPLAYRFLILDFDIWKRTDIKVQTAHLHQFIVFAHSSRFHRFNGKRLLKMHVVKKMLFALRTTIYPRELLPDFIATLKILVQHSFTSEVIRGLATFLASTLCSDSRSRKPSSAVSISRKASRNFRERDSHNKIRSVSMPRNCTPTHKTMITDVKKPSLESDASNHSMTQIGLMVMEMLAEILCDESNGNFVAKFAQTITNKWPLLFLNQESPLYAVVLAIRILSRIFDAQGSQYVQKFRNSDGFLTMQSLLPAHWNSSQLIAELFAMGFGLEDIRCSRFLDIETLSQNLQKKKGDLKVIYPEPIMICLRCIKQSIRAMVRQEVGGSNDIDQSENDRNHSHFRPRSKSLIQSPVDISQSPLKLRSSDEAVTSSESFLAKDNDKLPHIDTIGKHLISFAGVLTHLYKSSSVAMRDFLSTPEFLDDYVDIIFGPSCGMVMDMTPDEELNSWAFGLNYDVDVAFDIQTTGLGQPGSAWFTRLDPLGNTNRNLTQSKSGPLERRSSSQSAADNNLITTSDRVSTKSFPSVIPSSPSSSIRSIVFLAPRELKNDQSSINPSQLVGANPDGNESSKNNALEALVGYLILACVDTITNPSSKSLVVFDNIVNSLPPSDLPDQISFLTYLLKSIIVNLKRTLDLNVSYLTIPRILVNISRFSQRVVDLIYQGWFHDGSTITMDFLSHIVENLQILENQGRMKGQEQPIFSLYRAIDRLVLFQLAALYSGNADSPADSKQIGAMIDRLVYIQKVILAPGNVDCEFLACLSFQMYRLLIHDDLLVRSAALNFWKLMMLNKPVEMSIILNTKVKGIEYKELAEGFSKLMETDVNSFFVWVENHKSSLDSLFFDQKSKVWDIVVMHENRNTRDLVKNMHSKRISKLRKLCKSTRHESEFMSHYISKTKNWVKTINEVEWNRLRKTTQDIADQQSHIHSLWINVSRELYSERALLAPSTMENVRWRLDFTEGKYRMRKKLQVNRRQKQFTYTPKNGQGDSRNTTPDGKRTSSNDNGNRSVKKLPILKLDTNHMSNVNPGSPFASSPCSSGSLSPTSRENDDDRKSEKLGVSTEDVTTVGEPDSDYEMVEGPRNHEEIDDEGKEDKNRKVLRSLEPGDIVLDVFNISRIVGLDACEGLLLLGKRNIYIIDSYFQKKDGEIVDVWDAPKDERDQYLQIIASNSETYSRSVTPSKAVIVNLENNHEARRWAYSDIQEVLKRRFLFRDVALELFFADGRSYLITLCHGDRDGVYTRLMGRLSQSAGAESVQGVSGDITAQGTQRTQGGLTSQITSRLANAFSQSTVYKVTKRWERREISNFQYLMLLNTMAGRTYNDLTQYPVFPWVLADYTSEELDLTKPETFRDLAKPMGAQTPERRVEFQERYQQWLEMDDDVTKPFHYGTHYSSAMIVCSYLIRLEPFTQQYLKLQGGHFDHADRLFHSLGGAWLSASKENRGDVRELIPEFFYLPEFLVNSNGYDFGVKQTTGEVIDSVVLPPWAKGDPKIFIAKHREALESEYVSTHLHSWIDLIFGYKQQGQEAVNAVNVFHHLSYEGAIDLDKIEDPVQRTASIGIIHNFGQTPRQLFSKPHAMRLGKMTDLTNSINLYKLEENVNLLIESVAHILDIGEQISRIYSPNEGERIMCVPSQQLLIPPNHNLCVAWGFVDGSLRVYQTESRRLVGLFESMHLDYISCACFSDADTFVTGGTDTVVCVWKLTYGKTMDFKLDACFRGHSKPITSIAVSRSFSIIVSGSEDMSAIIWDLNRGTYVRQLPDHEDAVQLVSINNLTGDIATCSGGMLRLWTINGELLVKRGTSQMSDPICSIGFYEGIGSEWLSQELVFTGHKRGVVQIWKKVISKADDGVTRWDLHPVHRLQHVSRFDGVNISADITSIHFVNRMMYTGNSDGCVKVWCLPDEEGEENRMSEGSTSTCLSCGIQFGVLERRAHCKACGGIFCVQRCLVLHPELNTRICKICSGKVVKAK